MCGGDCGCLLGREAVCVWGSDCGCLLGREVRVCVWGSDCGCLLGREVHVCVGGGGDCGRRREYNVVSDITYQHMLISVGVIQVPPPHLLSVPLKLYRRCGWV